MSLTVLSNGGKGFKRPRFGGGFVFQGIGVWTTTATTGTLVVPLREIESVSFTPLSNANDGIFLNNAADIDATSGQFTAPAASDASRSLAVARATATSGAYFSFRVEGK